MDNQIAHKILDQVIELNKKYAKLDSTLHHFGLQLTAKTSEFKKLEKRMDALENFKLKLETKEKTKADPFWQQLVEKAKQASIVLGLIYICYDIYTKIGA